MITRTEIYASTSREEQADFAGECRFFGGCPEMRSDSFARHDATSLARVLQESRSCADELEP